MTSQEAAFEEIRGRLIRLERQNRRLKQMGAAALIVAASMILMGQASQKKTVEANEFILRDNSGKVRASLSLKLNTSIAQLVLFDSEGTPRAQLDSGVAAFGGNLSLTDAHGKDRVMVSAMDLGDRKMTLVLDPVSVGFNDSEGNPKAAFASNQLYLSDSQGFSAQMGVSNLVTPHTGETHQTSAASLVLFDKDQHVIWKAP
jgi:hypothetical protein